MYSHINTLTPIIPLATLVIAIIGVIIALAKLSHTERARALSWTKTLILSVITITLIVFGLLNMYWFISGEGAPTRIEVLNLFLSGISMYIWVRLWGDSVLAWRQKVGYAELTEAIQALEQKRRAYYESQGQTPPNQTEAP